MKQLKYNYNSKEVQYLIKQDKRLKNLFQNQKEVIVNSEQMTSVEGLFAAGDITNQPYKQIIISAADGAKAALAATKYINQK